jgi:hypothetical protein
MKLENVTRGDSFLDKSRWWVVLAQVDRELGQTLAIVRKIEVDGSYFPDPKDVRWGVCWRSIGDEVDKIVRGGSFEIPEYLEESVKAQLGMSLMTREKAIEHLKTAPNGMADKVLCDFLTTLGYSDVSDAYYMVKMGRGHHLSGAAQKRSAP